MCLGDPKYRSNLFQWTNTRVLGRLAACRNHFLWPLSAHFQEGAENQPNPNTFFETQVILRVSYRFVSSINHTTTRVLTPFDDFQSQNVSRKLCFGGDSVTPIRWIPKCSSYREQKFEILDRKLYSSQFGPAESHIAPHIARRHLLGVSKVN